MISRDPYRILRNELLADAGVESAPSVGASPSTPGRGTLRFVGRVVDGGAISRDLGRIYLFHPVAFDGDESERSSALIRADAARLIPVVVIGSHPPAVGDLLVAHATGGRWVAVTGPAPPNCNPEHPPCPGIRYSANGTVDDPLNGVQPLIYDYGKQAWYSPWLRFTSPYVLATSSGFDPCTTVNGVSYYYHKLVRLDGPGAGISASLFLPGRVCHDAIGRLVGSSNNYTGPLYPALLGAPPAASIAGLSYPSLVTPGTCDPLVIDAVWGAPGTPTQLPVAQARYSIPRFVAPSHGFTCATPCPLPRRNLVVSWVHTGGNGMGTLAWNDQSQDWTLACEGNLSIRLHLTPGGAAGFTATLWDGPACSGAPHPYSHPATIGLTSFTCEPFYFSYKILLASSLLYQAGYRSFAITE